MWVLFSLLTALFQSLASAVGKTSLKHLHPLQVAASSQWIGFILMALMWAVFDRNIYFDNNFVIALLCSTALNLIATRLYYEGLSRTELSLGVPLLNMTPIWMLATGPLIAGDQFNRLGVIGILLSVIGISRLQISNSENFGTRISKLFHDHGCQFMLGCSFLWAFTSAFDRAAIQHSSPLWYGVTHLAILATGTTIWAQRFCGLSLEFSPIIGLNALLNNSASLLQFNAMALAPSAYVISIKRTSALFALLWGYLFFGEKNARFRIWGTLLTCLAVACVAWG